MASGGLHGWTRLPGGEVLARFHETDPTVDCGSLDVFVVAATRTEAVAKAKALGLHGINLKTNPSPPTDQERRAAGPSRTRSLASRAASSLLGSQPMRLPRSGPTLASRIVTSDLRTEANSGM
jgi:hypothetical protein